MPIIISLFAAAMLAQVAAEAPTTAPPAQAAPAMLSEGRDIARPMAVGRLLYDYDRAAWVSTDALTASVPAAQLAGAGGYVIEPGDGRALRVTYYRGTGEGARAFFTADVRDGKVVRKTLLEQPVALTAGQQRLAGARTVAADTARTRAYRPCTPFSFNTVVLPPDADGTIAVYLLSAQEARSYPLGGYYRVAVAPDGHVVASRPYTLSCLNMSAPAVPAGATPAGFAINHLLDPIPTEIHVFASYSLGLPLYVSTPDQKLWRVQKGRIVAAGTR